MRDNFRHQTVSAVAEGKARIEWVDYARGLAVILVVYGHCSVGLSAAGYVANGSWLPTIEYVIYGFHMPLFFCLSGLFAPRTIDRGWAYLCRHRLLAILHPYLLWMTIEIAVLMALSGQTNQGAISFSLGTYLYLPIAPFWFLHALITANLFVYALRGVGKPVLLAVSAVLFLTTVHLEPALAHLTPYGTFYFVIGFLFADRIKSPAVAARLGQARTLCLSGAAMLACGAAGLELHIDHQLALPLALTGSVFVFSVAQHLARAARSLRFLSCIAYVGQISLTILVVHIFGTAGARILLSKLLHIKANWVHLAFGTFAGVMLPVAVQLVADACGLTHVLGLPQHRRNAQRIRKGVLSANAPGRFASGVS